MKVKRFLKKVSSAYIFLWVSCIKVAPHMCFIGGGVSTTIGGIIDAGDEFNIYHSILLGQMKTFGIKKNNSQILPKHPLTRLP